MYRSTLAAVARSVSKTSGRVRATSSSSTESKMPVSFNTSPLSSHADATFQLSDASSTTLIHRFRSFRHARASVPSTRLSVSDGWISSNVSLALSFSRIEASLSKLIGAASNSSGSSDSMATITGCENARSLRRVPMQLSSPSSIASYSFIDITPRSTNSLSSTTPESLEIMSGRESKKLKNRELASWALTCRLRSSNESWSSTRSPINIEGSIWSRCSLRILFVCTDSRFKCDSTSTKVCESDGSDSDTTNNAF
ncbi:hypothetical protein OGAPHI_006644 [Ogataea philodendri]|uniref:Uncharacterized protein n=1 Tax=Ogataea philodendri TaxID=1378263 RepID=A0A9P8NXH8_9ASCO|nr:uncharacterized protein OGAPHI_006644 [Ogataea philodendri]KAH3661237.1 hypothetical protein OGAPHI_006644 [Ogataea philodendri]